MVQRLKLSHQNVSTIDTTVGTNGVTVFMFKRFATTRNNSLIHLWDSMALLTIAVCYEIPLFITTPFKIRLIFLVPTGLSLPTTATHLLLGAWYLIVTPQICPILKGDLTINCHREG